MPFSLAETTWHKDGLNGTVQVGWGTISGARSDLVAAAGEKVFLFTPADQTYFLSSSVALGKRVLALAVGLPVSGSYHVVLGFEDTVKVYGWRAGELYALWETESEPGARFVDLALADIDGDGKEEVIAASESKEALYIFRMPEGGMRLNLAAIRVLPGPAQKVTALALKGEQRPPVIAAAYRNNGASGLFLLTYTEMGFVEGPAMVNLSTNVTSLTKGDLRTRPGEEIAWGGADGMLRVMEVNRQLESTLISDNLGSVLPALTSGRLWGENSGTLIAGTPEGYLFGFKLPVEQKSPDWAVRINRPINDLALSNEGLIGIGTADGGVQVWKVSTEMG
ncbi:hypothetical protein PTH_1419 [Pelotomaculum thermopropionicum SI]|uniref:VCBS repeat-containing protein n=1 Tax=Pelotomaculum thermopropionicum (strain DSM 13744 / JCM 10971 / SI) TaxID=370438 RepID=A5D2C1_PELTS|nr:hypothetical protein PTH_1419 [Pelotomaculum thermopropionicum SI]